MTTKTITGSYPSGYDLNASYDTLNVASTANVGGAGITTTSTQPSTINNVITLSDGGTMTNNGMIGGTSPVVVGSAAGDVHNYGNGTIQSDRIFSANYSFYGANDGSYYRRPSIRMTKGGAVTNDASKLHRFIYDQDVYAMRYSKGGLSFGYWFRFPLSPPGGPHR